MRRCFEIGMLVILRIQRHSTSLEPNAKGVYASPHGEDYTYYIEEYARVTAVLPDGKLMVCTPDGPQYMLRADEPMLRQARWWERWLFRKCFPCDADVFGRTSAEVTPLEGDSLRSPVPAGWP